MLGYLVLGVVAIAIVAAVWVRGVSLVSVALFLVVGGSIGYGDLAANALFRLYTYSPGLVSADFPFGLVPQWVANNHLGVVIAECLFVPVLVGAVARAGMVHPFKVSLALAAGFGATELVLLRMGQFQHHGWSVWYTLGLFTPYCFILFVWARRFSYDGYTGVHRLMIIAMTLAFVLQAWTLVINGILGLWVVRPYLLESTFSDLVVGAVLYHSLPVALFGTVAIWNQWLQRPVALAAIMGGVVLWPLLLWQSGLWENHSPVSPVLEGVCLALLVYGSGLVDRWFLTQQEQVMPRLR
jgi:hypothetical protein